MNSKVAQIKFDIDTLFKTMKGHILILVDRNGNILKANDLAYSLCRNKDIVLEGKNWDNTFYTLGLKYYNFSKLLESHSQPIHVEFKINGSSELFELQIDKIEQEKDSLVNYLISGHKQHSGTIEEMLFKIMKGTSKSRGRDFLESVTENIAKTLNVDFVFIGKYVSDAKMIETQSLWYIDHLQENVNYIIEGTPCEEVHDKKQVFIPENVQKIYPKSDILKELKAEGYRGAPIFYSDGQPYGVLVTINQTPLEESASATYILNIFANRIGAEVEWTEIKESLQAKDRKLSEIIETIPHPIFHKDREGRFEGFNQAFREAVGLSDEEIIGKQTLNTSDGDQHISIDKELLTKANKVNYDTELDLESGEKKYFLMTKSTILDHKGNIDGLVGVAVDITSLREAESNLKRSEERYRTLFSTANDTIFIMNKEIFIDCNEKTLEMFDCTREEIIGHPPYEFSPKYQPDGKNSKESALQKINGALAGNKQNFYWRHATKNGVEFDAEVSLSAIYISNELFIMAIVRDITDKLQLVVNTEIQKERMETMYKYISEPNISLNEQLNSLLQFATKSLGYDKGFISRIDGSRCKLTHQAGEPYISEDDKPNDVSDTYCWITYSQNRQVAIEDLRISKYRDHPSYNHLKMNGYLGTPYWVRGKNYGTVTFLSDKPVTSFRPIDLDFVQMLAQWIGSAIEREQFERNLMERDAVLETLLREIPLDFSVRDENLNMIIQSDISKELWGNNEGKPIDYSDVDPKSGKKWKKIYKNALAGKATKGEDHVKIYGKAHTFYSVVSPVKIREKVSEVITINLDISKLKETEEKLLEQNEQLKKLNNELDRFVYSASHDLRAPLASLLGLIDLANRERNSEATQQYLDLMSNSINTLDNFITNITGYSRNIRLEINSVKIDFEKLIKESFEHIRFMIPEPATYEINVIGDSDFYSDPDRIAVILNNLISNSIRYKCPNKDAHIKFSVKYNSKSASLSIADNGIGIKAEHLSKVFDMFYRASESKSGSGLGLYIVKETIDKLRGKVSIESKYNNGTTITIKLPNMLKS